jgi:methyl-accepting chemotaxis protein
MHHVAVSSEEQSKGIAEIAAAASALTDASTRITELVSTFKLGGS